MNMRPVIEAAVRELMRSPRKGRGGAAPYVVEVRSVLIGLDVGVQDVGIVGDRGRSDNVVLRIVMVDGWKPLDETWGPEDSIAAMFNAMETAGYRHVPGTSRFLPDGSTLFVKDGITFDFIPPPFDDDSWGT